VLILVQTTLYQIISTRYVYSAYLMVVLFRYLMVVLFSKLCFRLFILTKMFICLCYKHL